jgi:endonuclease-3
MAALRDILVPIWPDSRPLLDFSDCFQLLGAVVMSAQCTDEQVNAVTPSLFARYPDPAAMAAADVADVESCIHSVGFFRTKARHLVETSRMLVERHDGKVPDTMEALLELPGVGRKTANLVISACFGKPGIIVDTHVMRVAFRLGIHGRKDPGEIEKRIAEALPPEDHTAFSHALNRHGKFTCTSRNPACAKESGYCPVLKLCPRRGLA